MAKKPMNHNETIKWTVKLKGKRQFKKFNVSVKYHNYFTVGNKYYFNIIAGGYKTQRHLSFVSNKELSVIKEIPAALEKASKKVDFVEFEWLQDGAQAEINNFESEVTKSLSDTFSAREKRLKKAKKLPEGRLIQTVVFTRNPDVVAEVLIRADGVCECCGNEAPFKKKSNGDPYLEVHHIVRLADAGEDTVENAEALCPNCHRKKHFG